MSAFSAAMTQAAQMLEAGEVDEEMLGGLELTEVLTGIASLISKELMHLSGLGEDADENETIMRNAMQQAAVKAFFAGILVAPAPEDSIKIAVPTEALEAIAINALKSGQFSFTLVGADDNGE